MIQSRSLKLAASCLLVLNAYAVLAAEKENLNPINPAKGAKTWTWKEQGVSLRLTQILPEQLRGFFQARGFSQADAERIANACVFQTVIRNMSSDLIRVDLMQWRVDVSKGNKQPPRIREVWDQEWSQRESPSRARLAFRWALFPTEQTFNYGDWNMGMTSYGLKPGATFDLYFSWRAGGERHQAEIHKVQCAHDTTPN